MEHMNAGHGPYIQLVRDLLPKRAPNELLAPGMRRAAVLLLLYHLQGEDRILLTKRTETVEHHKGQISFPGGGVDPEDTSLEHTALRETWEEVGIHPDHVEVLGRLDDIVTISDFLVTPIVGVLHVAPYAFVTSDHEVAVVLETPIRHLLDEANLVIETREQNGRVVQSPAYWWEGHRIWGATARMLERFLDMLRDAPERLDAIGATRQR